KDANRPFAHTLAGAALALEDDGLATVVLGGASPDADELEGALSRAVVKKGPSRPRVQLTGRTALRETLPILAGAAVATGGDTGPLHIAAALGTPVVALFGGANPARTGPQGALAHVIWKRWHCAPCYRWQCPIGRECLDAISGDEVAAAARALVS